MDNLLDMLETLKNQYEGSMLYSQYHPMVKLAWDKLDYYYGLTDRSPVYIAAVVLNPFLKWKFFDTKWHDRKDWLVVAREEVKRLWETDYKDETIAQSNDLVSNEQDQSMPSSVYPSLTDSQDSTWLAFMAPLLQVKGHSNALDEYEQYCKEEILDTEVDVLSWWGQQRKRWPCLSAMAIELLSIPAMSSEVERSFSSAKLTVSPQRNRLHASTIEAIECIRSWNKSKLCI